MTLLGFYGCCRIGEVLRATRADLQTPCDLLRSDTRFFLQIKEPKTKHRGPRVQHVVVVLPEKTAQFVQRVCGKLPRCASLFYGSPAVYRKRWDCLLERLGISQSFRLTPGSLRGGGAVATCPAGAGISTLQWRIRQQHQATIGSYLQEVAAGSILPALRKQWPTRLWGATGKSFPNNGWHTAGTHHGAGSAVRRPPTARPRRARSGTPRGCDVLRRNPRFPRFGSPSIAKIRLTQNSA